MMGDCKFVLVFVVLMSIGFFSPKPGDDALKGPKIASKEFQSKEKITDQPKRRKTRILNGITVTHPPSVGEPPWLDWIVSIRAEIDRTLFTREFYSCAGALISRNHVLTALHCVTYKKPLNGKVVTLEPEKIQLFTNSLRKREGTELEAKKIFYYSNAINAINGDIIDDIALIKLKNTIPDQIAVNPILLPERALGDDDDYWMAGWGATKTYPQLVRPHDLKQFLQTKKDRAICSNIPDLLEPEKYLCFNRWNWSASKNATGVTGQGTCNGDSGSQGVISSIDPTSNELKWYLQGIHESGLPALPKTSGSCNDSQSYGIDMNVWYYKNSILRWIKL